MIDYSKNKLITKFGSTVLKDRYLKKDQDPQVRFAELAHYYSNDNNQEARIYSYISDHWFMPATPILSNGGTEKGLPISCFLNSVQDSMDSIAEVWSENSHLSAAGGGIGTCWSKVRSLYEDTKTGTKSSGIIPFIRVMDSISIAVNQGSLRRGAASVYLDVSHPEIEEFLDIRKQTGDYNRRCLNLNQGVTIPDSFMEAVRDDKKWDLIGPKDKKIKKIVSARAIWGKILETRLQTGEPYLLWTDNCETSELRKKLGLKIEQSNLCSEITLPTGKDYNGKNRTAVCCLGSVNLNYFEEWKNSSLFIYDCLCFLDNVLKDFIKKTEGLEKYKHARYSAQQERSIGLGAMGFHSYLQANEIPFGSFEAKLKNKIMFQHLNLKTKEANHTLYQELGPCPDAGKAGFPVRFSHTTAIAPTANISIIAGECSPCVEPWNTNIFTQKTLSGSFEVRNKELENILILADKNTPDVWESIVENEGSVSHLEFLTDLQKEVFKTSWEIDQKYIIEFAADRAPLIDQSQSINLFVPSTIHKKDLHNLHFSAWEKKVKSLYYLRTKVSNRTNFIKSNFEECSSCQ